MVNYFLQPNQDMTLLDEGTDPTTTTVESSAALNQVAILTGAVRDLIQEKQALQDELGKLKEHSDTTRRALTDAKQLGDQSVQGIFDFYGFPKTYADGSAIPTYLLKREFSKALKLTTETGRTTSEERKLRIVAAAFLFHSLGVIHDDPLGLFDLVFDVLSPSKLQEKESMKAAAIRDSAVVQVVVSAARESMANKDQHSTTAGILAPLTAQYTRIEMLHSFQLDVSVRLWRYARWHTLAWGVQGTAPTERVWRFRGKKEQVVELVKFAEDNVQVIAWGDTTITGINGEALTIPPHHPLGESCHHPLSSSCHPTAISVLLTGGGSQKTMDSQLSQWASQVTPSSVLEG